MQHKGTKLLETTRLLLRPWKESDAEEAFAHWMNDPEVTKYLTWTPHGDIEVTRALLKIRERESAEPHIYNWAIVLKEGNVLIGDIAVLRADDFQERGTLGYCMGKAWWGKGIMTEALSEVLRYCFEEVGFFRIDGEHAAENIGSSRVMEKCGLVYEGTRRKYFRLPSTGERVDIVERGILREEYFKTARENLCPDKKTPPHCTPSPTPPPKRIFGGGQILSCPSRSGVEHCILPTVDNCWRNAT